MDAPAILLVTASARETQRIADALTGLGLPYPTYVPSGEAAVNWIVGHRCDACIVDYRLPGIDGLETLVRLHQRRPDLPVVIVSDARSEEVAVAAFRAGVSDYVPKAPGYADAVATHVQRVIHALPIGPASQPQAAREDILAQLLRPTYQNRLRAIGRQLDLYGYRSANLLEIAGGFVVRVLAPGSRVPEALEFPDRDFPLLMAAAFDERGERLRERSVSPLLPTGYEDVFRALGHRLDWQQAEAITIADLDAFVAVAGVGRVEQSAGTTIGPFRTLLRPEDIAQLLDEAVRRRATPARRAGLGWLRAQRAS